MSLMDDERDAAANAEELRVLRAEVSRLRAALTNVKDLGHNDDCIFCGLKDREAIRATIKEGT